MVSFLFLFSFFKSIISQSHKCYYSDCLSCNSDYSCHYNNGICSSQNLISSKIELINQLNNCNNDLYSNPIINKYCGSLDIQLSNKQINIVLPKIDNQYGKEYLFCSYKIKNLNPSSTIYIEVKKEENYSSSFDLFIQNKLDDGLFPIEGTFNSYKIKKIENFNLTYHSKISFKNKPFEVIIKLDKFKIPIKKIIIICLVTIFFIAIIICILIIIYYKKEILSLNLFRNINAEREEELNIKEKNKSLAREFINNIFPILYENIREKAKNTLCNFCLNEFNSKDQVYIGDCNHVFHFDEIKQWIYSEDSFHNTCPECRNELICFYHKGDNLNEPHLINVGHYIQENNNNNNNDNNEMINNNEIINKNDRISNNDPINNNDKKSNNDNISKSERKNNLMIKMNHSYFNSSVNIVNTQENMINKKDDLYHPNLINSAYDAISIKLNNQHS